MKMMPAPCPFEVRRKKGRRRNPTLLYPEWASPSDISAWAGAMNDGANAHFESFNHWQNTKLGTGNHWVEQLDSGNELRDYHFMSDRDFDKKWGRSKDDFSTMSKIERAYNAGAFEAFTGVIDDVGNGYMHGYVFIEGDLQGKQIFSQSNKGWYTDYVSLGNNQNGGSVQQAGFGDGLTSTQLAIAALKPSFLAAASQAKHGGSVPFHLKKNIFKSPHVVNNNAVRLGKVSGSFARNGAAIMKVATPALTMTAVVTNGISIFSDGQLTWGDAFVGDNTALQIAFPVYGVIYGVVDVGASYMTGTSLTDYTKNAIDSNVSGSINLGY